MNYTQRARRRRLTKVGCGVAVAALVLAGETSLAGSAFGKPKPPKPVSNPGKAVSAPTGARPKSIPYSQLQADVRDENSYATLVGQTNGQIAAIKIKLQQSQARVELAEQKVALTHSKALIAQADATRAQRTADAAGSKVTRARAAYIAYIQSTYYGGTLEGTTGAVLTATDPSELLEASNLESFAAEHKRDAVTALQTATVYQSNANAKAKLANQAAKKAEAAAKKAVVAAQETVNNQKTEKANLQADLATQQDNLARAQATKAADYTQQGKYIAYQTKEAAYQAYVAQYSKYQNYLKAQAAYEKAQAEAAAKARERARQHSGGGGGGGGGGSSSGGGGGGPSVGGGSAPSGSWTAAKGRQAVKRARSTLGIIYAWAGGNQYGPTRGVCAGNGAWNDCNVTGFDCSGLVMYAWGKGWDHYAATQYSEAGSYHPSPGNFMPGDLLFWSEDGTQGGIGHVAIYIGHGDVIQAPESGEVITITPWDQVEYGYFGATRPLT